MSDLMTRCVIMMPLEIAMSSELSRMQFHSRAQDLLVERDTYRDLCAELLKAAQGYVPHMPVSTAKVGGANRYSGMLKASDNLKDAIAKAVTILGENNAT